MKLHSEYLDMAELKLFDSDKASNKAFDGRSARIYHWDGKGDLEFVDSDKDIYELLEDEDIADALAEYPVIQFGIATYGWASPLDPDADEDSGDNERPPSEHPERRRVRLLIVCNAEEQISFLRFDDEQSVVAIEQCGTGSLSDACRSLVKKATKINKKNKKAGK